MRFVDTKQSAFTGIGKQNFRGSGEVRMTMTQSVFYPFT
jgi:hypothetical protein